MYVYVRGAAAVSLAGVGLRYRDSCSDDVNDNRFAFNILPSAFRVAEPSRIHYLAGGASLLQYSRVPADTWSHRRSNMVIQHAHHREFTNLFGILHVGGGCLLGFMSS